MVIRFFDVQTAIVLAQILPVLLLTLMVEMRRLKWHRRHRARSLLAVFFSVFGVVETVLVLSIDGRVYPFQWSDLVAALVIFGLLVMLFVMSMLGGRDEESEG